MHTLVKLQAIPNSYMLDKGDVTSVREVTLEIDAGEFVALSGASDRGKATLLNVTLHNKPLWRPDFAEFVLESTAEAAQNATNILKP